MSRDKKDLWLASFAAPAQVFRHCERKRSNPGPRV